MGVVCSDRGRPSDALERPRPQIGVLRYNMPMRLLGYALLTLALAGCGSSVPSESPSQSAIQPTSGASMPSATQAAVPIAAGPCRSLVDNGVLPTWARAGFSDPEPAMPHVMSRSGDIVAILFGYPLSSPPQAKVNNKILWVQRAGPTGPVDISAQRVAGATPVGGPVERRLDEGFGPSIVDLPNAGCWRLTLAFGDRTDTIDLDYAPSPTS